MRRTPIALLRALLFALWTVLAALCVLFARIARRSSWQQYVFRLWARGALRVLNVHLAVTGAAPPPPCLLVSNHLGYLDIVVFAATVDARFVAKSDVASWPFFGRLVRALGTIFIDRSKRHDVLRVNQLIDDALRAGQTVIVFAEGTSSDGRDVLPLRPSLLGPVTDGRRRVHYARVAYTTSAGAVDAAQSVCWWGDAAFLPHVWGLFHVPQTRAILQFGSDAITGDNRKALANTVHERIRSLTISAH